jgi:hypothetical protein
MVRFSCPSCNRTLQAPEDRAGKLAVCPGCKQQLQIPTPPPPQPDPIPYAEIREAPPPMPRPAPQPVPSQGGRAEYDEPPAEQDLEPGLRRRPPGPSGNWAWRWCSPSVLLLSLFMLPLPFLEVQCSPPLPAQGMRVALVNQSGLQMMTGRYSIDSSIDQFNKQMAGFGVPVNPGQVPWAPGGPQQLNVKPAPLMIVIPFLLLAGIAVGLALRPTALRVPLVAGTVVAALALLFVQMAVGFPLEREVRESMEREMRKAEQQLKAFGGGPAGGNPFGGPGGGNPFGPGMGVNPFGGAGVGMRALTEMVQTRYTPWFWIWLVLLVGSLGPLVGEMIWSLTRRPRRRWRPAYAEDY